MASGRELPPAPQCQWTEFTRQPWSKVVLYFEALFSATKSAWTVRVRMQKHTGNKFDDGDNNGIVSNLAYT